MPDSAVSMILGRSGIVIKEMMEQSGESFPISSGDHEARGRAAAEGFSPTKACRRRAPLVLDRQPSRYSGVEIFLANSDQFLPKKLVQNCNTETDQDRMNRDRCENINQRST